MTRLQVVGGQEERPHSQPEQHEWPMTFLGRFEQRNAKKDQEDDEVLTHMKSAHNHLRCSVTRRRVVRGARPYQFRIEVRHAGTSIASVSLSSSMRCSRPGWLQPR